ncbi:prephenate dehydratase [Candidatus Aerophobetes bacterium]|uniref:Bifunctional chorismate mutase/prephenate dehydratase n=1 Tax=Aerophobetes bacterium TaxID=2030807 RepID=A0A523V1Z4_UNCAE|nr:MAG: prephenate dehydratase [Candidatus Aerophobetes bacterium]
MQLENLRRQIDEIDSKLVDLLNERIRKVFEIAEVKRKRGGTLYSPAREKRILQRLIQHNQGPLPNEALLEIMQLILKTSLTLQSEPKVVYFGPPATFTHLAAIKNFGRRAELIPEKSISGIFSRVEKKQAEFGVVPVENSTEGVVTHTLDMFLDSDLKICAETVLEISHHLLGRGFLEKVKKIYSHPQALAQCRGWLEENVPTVRLAEVESTARAAQMAAKDLTCAAIASDVAASLYNLNIIASHIEDSPHNYTRFLVVGREYNKERSGQDKTSILFSIKDRVGALHEMLAPFLKYGINLTKIESRPTKRRAWEYVFFLDFVGYKDEEKIKKALGELEESCFFLKVLGSYPRGE